MPERMPEIQSMLVSMFHLRGALCALDTALVEEVVRWRRATRVPHAPPHVVGVINLRGKIVTVIDLGRKLDLGEIQPTEDSRLYIVRDQDEAVGLLVDRSADVIEMEPAELEPPPANVRGAEGRFFRGVGRAAGRLVALLDPAEALSL
ncbi:MAG TPA: chemotaxis protein CheW [Bryobacteraceae bacterium]|jgi:purine-binding chemotaxis protein CheW